MNLVDKALAAPPTEVKANQITSFLNIRGDGATTLNDLVNIAITWVTWIAGIMAFIYLVYSGILYLTASGNPDAAKKGQQGIINSIIGIIIIVFAYVILNVISNAAFSGTADSGNTTIPTR